MSGEGRLVASTRNIDKSTAAAAIDWEIQFRNKIWLIWIIFVSLQCENGESRFFICSVQDKHNSNQILLGSEELF